MPLEKRNISIPLGLGIDTKTDPNQINPGALLALTNATKKEALALQKRNGYQSLTGITQAASSATYPVGLATFEDTLVTITNDQYNSLLTFTPNVQTNSGANATLYTPLDLSTTNVARSLKTQTNPDSAYMASIDVALHAWIDTSTSVTLYSFITGKGEQVTPPAQIGSGAGTYATWPLRTLVVGNYFILMARTSSTLVYFAFNSTFDLLNDPFNGTTIATNLYSTGGSAYFDAAVIGNTIYVSWDVDPALGGGTGSIQTVSINSSLVQSAPVTHSGQGANSAISVHGDNSKIWTAFSSSTNSYYFVIDGANLSDVTPLTYLGATSGIQNLIGTTVGGANSTFLAQISNVYSGTTIRSDFLVPAVATTGADVSQFNSLFPRYRGVALHSRYYEHNSNAYFVAAYGPNNALAQQEEPTYFLMNDNQGYPVAKIAFTNGGGYASSNGLNYQITSINQVTESSFQFDYLTKDLLLATNNTVGAVGKNPIYTQTGINSALIDVNAPGIGISKEIGSNLNLCGGYLSMYDGNTSPPNNFHLFPEDLLATSASSGVGLAAGTYNYSATYEWMDKKGNLFRSAPSTPLAIKITSTTASAVINVTAPTYRIPTLQPDVKVVFYRTAPSISATTFYQVSSIPNPISNDKTIDTVTFIDTQADSAIVGNNLLYTTGGVVENTGGPPCYDMAIFDSRLWVLNAENRLQRWFSKQVIQGTPVEMSDLLTSDVDPRFGDATAIATMDDKLITFKENAIFYLTGSGPDNTGANSQFSEDIFVTSQVGCTNPKSVVLTQDGLMFQSNKGIWLLGRDLSVLYIGAAVEAYNSILITSANVIPNTTEVRFSLESGIVLVWDYLYKQWSVFSNMDAVGAVIYNGLYTYLTSSPATYLLQETPGVYSDNGSPILMGLQTAWLQMGGLQGFQRVYDLYFKGQYISPHVLSVKVAYDYNPNPVQKVNIPVSALFNNANYGQDPYYGSGPLYGGRYPNEQYQISTTRQKCQAIQVTIQEELDTSNYTLGAGVIMEALGAVIGVKSTYPRLPETQKVN